MAKKQQITDDLDALLDVLPLDIRHAVEKANNSENLLEIILDLGRIPTVRFVDSEVSLRNTEITRAELDYVDERVTARALNAHCIASLRSATDAARWLV